MVAFKNLLRRPKREEEEFTFDEELQNVDFLTSEEARADFDRMAQRELGISGEEFLRRWDAGEYPPVPDTKEGRKVGRLVMMLPLAGRAHS